MPNEQTNDGRYTIHGYKDRDDYLDTLADDQGIDRAAVRLIADMLGPSEDFDGLISELEDFYYLGMFDGPEPAEAES
jgi:hypothetical protein